MNAAERAGYGDLDLLGRRLSAIYPVVGDFAAHAMAEIDGLRKRDPEFDRLINSFVQAFR